MEYNKLEFIDLANDIAQLKEKYSPYHVNILSELHASEDAHTRILVKLLQYNILTDCFI